MSIGTPRSPEGDPGAGVPGTVHWDSPKVSRLGTKQSLSRLQRLPERDCITYNAQVLTHLTGMGGSREL